MIHRIYSSLSKFKTLEFKQGLNLLLAEKHEESTDLHTRNRAGKSSFVQIVHFLLGGNANPESIFRKPEIEKESFGMEFDLGSTKVVAERRGKSQGRTRILEGASPDWPVQLSSRSGLDRSLSTDDWRRILGQIWFRLRDPKEDEKYGPTFRSLFCYFARRENDEGMRRPEMQSRMQQIWDQQVAVSFLLDLDWSLGGDLQRVRDREKSLKELRQAAKEGAFGSVISSSGQLRTQLVLSEQAVQRLQDTLRSFEVLPEYRELEREASDLTHQISEMSNANTLDEEFIETISRSLVEEKPPESRDIHRLYEETGVVLPDSVRKRFEDVEKFHSSIIANRRGYLETERTTAERRLTERRIAVQRLDHRRAEIMRLLQSKGALDQFQQLQQEASRLNAETETLRQRFEAALQLEGVTSELEMERNRILQRLRRDLTEEEERVDKAITTFQEVSNSLYEDAGSLTLDPTENGLKIEIQIQGQRSRGIQNMQVFCFDMMLMKISAGRGLGPGFVIHDSHLFDGVDDRQVGKALAIGAKIAAQCGWQYIVTLNEDDIPGDVPKDFKIEDYILPVRLNDKSEDGGLFGFRF